MGYTPKHAKPASLTTNTAANRRYALSALNGYRARHAAPAGSVRSGEGTATHELQVS